MKCPECDSEDSSVIDSRKQNDHVWRRRRCVCDFRFNTVEMIEVDIVQPSQPGDSIKILEDIETSGRLFLQFVEVMKEKMINASGVDSNRLNGHESLEQKVKPVEIPGHSTLVSTALKESACSADECSQ